MSNDEPVVDATEVINSIESDYGSEPDDDTWDQAFSQSQSQTQPVQTIPRIAIEEVEELEAQILPKDDEAPPSSLRIARIREHLVQAIAGLDDISRQTPSPRSPQRAKSIEIEYDESNRRSFSRTSTTKPAVMETDALTAATCSTPRRASSTRTTITTS